MSSPLITADLVAVDVDASDANAVIDILARRLHDAGRVTDAAAFAADVRAREAQTSTGMPGGLGIPHAKSDAVLTPSLAVAKVSGGVDFGAPDGDANLIFLIAAPGGGASEHLKILAALAGKLAHSDFTDALREQDDPAVIAEIVNQAVAGSVPATATQTTSARRAETPASEAKAGVSLKFVGVSSCPTGIAHTYMAAEALEQAAKAAGHELVMETQGSAGTQQIDQAVIDAADGVIFAADLEVQGRDRFAGKPTVDVGVKRGVHEPAKVIAEVVSAVERGDLSAAVTVGGASSGGMATKVDANARLGTRIRQWLMTGVSYMIPFVAAGGILIAISFMLAQVAWGGSQGAIEVTDMDQAWVFANFDWSSLQHWSVMLLATGQLAFGFLVPVLSGFIAYAIADRPGLVPGFVGGAAAAFVDAGFLGGLATGILAGLVAKWISGWKVPRGVQGIMPVVVIPLISSAIIGFFMLVLVGQPIASAMSGLTNWLEGMQGGQIILLGAIIGAMMGVDLGGPINKVAYTFAVTGLSVQGLATDATQYKVMAAAMGAGMVAPLAMAVATSLRKSLFTPQEQEAGKSAYLLGASFISEGAIPFAAGDPLRVIAASIVGSSVTGALSMGLGASVMAPHGGIWVAPLYGNLLWFVISVLAGVLVAAGIVIALKTAALKNKTAAAEAEDARVSVPA